MEIKKIPDWRGRPSIYESPATLMARINDYFTELPDKKIIYHKVRDDVIAKEIPCPTLTGLALYLGFASRQSLYDYESKKANKDNGFSYMIRKARTMIECEYEKLLQQPNCTGAIFALKNMGWQDKTELEADIQHSVINIIPAAIMKKQLQDKED